MKLMKRIPFQIFVLILCAGIAGISGMLIMQRNLNEIVGNYELIIEGSLQERLDMYDLCRLMNRHNMIISWYALSDSREEKLAYEEDAAELKAEILEIVKALNQNISGNEKEQLFHTVYSNTINYFNNAENVFKMDSESGSGTVKYYIVSYLANYIDNINADTNTMDEYITAEVDAVSQKMERSIEIAQISEIVCILCIGIVAAVCIVLCVSITSRLEKYKNQLEEENERKTQTLMEHNRRMLAIQDSTVIGMANLIENRDQDTGEHVKRTSKYVELLAREAQKAGYCRDILTNDYAELLVKAAPLHDIGKISVSDSILQKPGKLTPEEFEIMKGHTTAGGQMVAEVLANIENQDYIDIAAQIAERHHEKWDGSGYPGGLSGNDIPLCARIMAVADVFDALISKRCYKDPMSMDEAFSIIAESAGSHFDPVLAKLFCGIRGEVENALNNMGEDLSGAYQN
ncbi:MAG: HD domain-containing protein [Clostridium sp.]|nr:HD domain-containing protein [Clostridium sp.]